MLHVHCSFISILLIPQISLIHNPYSYISIIFDPIQYSVYRNSHHSCRRSGGFITGPLFQISFEIVQFHLNQHSYTHFLSIFNNYVIKIWYTLYTYHSTFYKTVKAELLFINKKTRIYRHKILMKTSIYSKMIAILKHCIYQNVCNKFLV